MLDRKSSKVSLKFFSSVCQETFGLLAVGLLRAKSWGWGTVEGGPGMSPHAAQAVSWRPPTGVAGF